MNKADLIDFIASEVNVSKQMAKNALDAFCEGVTKTLVKGDTVSLTGFGTFRTTKRAARTGHNPRTGAPIHIKARKVAVFRPGKELKEKVDK